jgi:hypothetical protein
MIQSDQGTRGCDSALESSSDDGRKRFRWGDLPGSLSGKQIAMTQFEKMSCDPDCGSIAYTKSRSKAQIYLIDADTSNILKKLTGSDFKGNSYPDFSY